MDGVLLIDKPAGMSSHDVVAAVKRAIDPPPIDSPLQGARVRAKAGRAKVGHAGTLDPFATGLLIVLVGRATKSQARLMALRKRYETVACLGATSTTGDTEGEITRTGRLPPDPPVLPSGLIAQRPPRYSAVKIGGERAYKRARRGERFELPERIVTVYRFEQRRREPEPEHEEPPCERAAYEIECSSGTYVRSLIADHLSDAYCLELRRTAIGPFAVSEAIAPPRRAERRQDPPPPLLLIPLEQALARLPA